MITPASHDAAITSSRNCSCSDMTDRKDRKNQTLVDKLVAVLLRLPWADILADACRTLHMSIQGRCYKTLYQAPEYESTLELKDPKGKKAAFKKREKERYLQDNVIAHQNQAWGDGEILLNDLCTLGTPADRCRSGYKTHVLISRHQLEVEGYVDGF